MLVFLKDLLPLMFYFTSNNLDKTHTCLNTITRLQNKCKISAITRLQNKTHFCVTDHYPVIRFSIEINITYKTIHECGTSSIHGDHITSF